MTWVVDAADGDQTVAPRGPEKRGRAPEDKDSQQYKVQEGRTESLKLSKMDIIEKMAATGPQPLGWRPQTALEWGMRMCSGVTSQLTEMGNSFEQLKSELRSSSILYHHLLGNLGCIQDVDPCCPVCEIATLDT